MLLAALITLPAIAVDQTNPPRLIRQGLANGNYKIQAQFPVGEYLHAWVIDSEPEGRSFIVYSTTDGMIIQGEIIDQYGTELTKHHIASYGIDKQATTEIIPSITEGVGNEALIDIFLEPHCNYCKELWNRLQPYNNRIQVRWHPVAFLQDDSAGVIQYVFDKENWSSRFPALMSQGIYQYIEPTKETMAILENNSKQMTDTGITSTPGGIITYKDGRKEAFQGLGILYIIAEKL
jgi:protein-disulfide isomerase